MPGVTSVNALGAIKPGATVLLSGTDERSREQIVLAYQRYGRGKALAFPIQDSWLWQMHDTMSVEDMTHENYWRQLLRWLVDGVPDHVEAQTNADRVEAGETVAVTASIVDPTFVEINDAHVVAHVTGPKGPIDVPLQWTGEKSGQYRGSFVAADEGVLHRAGRGLTRRQAARHRRRAASRRAGRRGVLRRNDAGGTAATDRGRDRRAVLHAGLDERTAGGRELQRPRHHDGRGARPLAHADRPGVAAGPDVRRVGVSPSGGTGVGKREKEEDACGPTAEEQPAQPGANGALGGGPQAH